VTTAYRRFLDSIALAAPDRSVPDDDEEDEVFASVHVYAWGNELAARSCVQLGLGLTSEAANELIGGGLPVSVLCSMPMAEAVAAFLAELGGKVDVTREPGMGVRILARMAPSF